MVKSSLSSKTVAFLKQQKLNNGLLVKQSKQVENASLISFAYSFVGRSNHYVYRQCFSRKRCISIPGPCYQMVLSLDSISAIKSVKYPDTLLIDACEFKKQMKRAWPLRLYTCVLWLLVLHIFLALSRLFCFCFWNCHKPVIKNIAISSIFERQNSFLPFVHS